MLRSILALATACVLSLGFRASLRTPSGPPRLRIACLGDSLTFGALVVDREHNAYPARLAHRVRARLGARAEVRNFGAGGRTLSRLADAPYVASEAWREALAWQPDVAVVILGTNDTCLDAERRCWEHEAGLEDSARAIVTALRGANPRARILLCSPPPIYPDAPGLDGAPLPEARRRPLAERAPRLARVAAALTTVAKELAGVEFVDLSRALRPEHVIDGVHTTPFGADALAAEVDAALGLGPPLNPAVVPIPSAEYRSGPAGWGADTWHTQVEKLRMSASAPPAPRVVLLGDSLTQGLTGSVDRRAHAGGPRPIDVALGELDALSLGLSGDRTEHVLWRIEHGALARCDPEVVVLQIGVNNVASAGHTAEETAEGIEAVVDLLLRREPAARVVVCGPFPCGTSPDDPRRLAIDAVHVRIAALDARERVTYADLRSLFLDADGRTNARMAADGIHLTRAGEAAWMSALAPLVAAK